MFWIGAAVNGVTVLLAGVAGGLLGRAIPKKMGETMIGMMALAVIYIGIDGCIADGQKMKYAALCVILSLALGTLIGELIDLDKWINKLGDLLQRKVGGKGNIAEGFVTASLLICVGAWAITGSIDSGVSGDHTSLIAKSVIDGVSCFVMASTLGVGVAFAGVLVFLYQGLLSLGAAALSGFLTESMIAAMGCTGSVLIVGIGFNMLGMTKLRVINAVPGIFLAIPISMLITHLL